MKKVEESTIVEIAELGESLEYVYDIGMYDNPKMFFGNGILVHNSVFYPAKPLVKKFYPETDVNSHEEMSEKILDITSIIQEFLNKSLDMYAKRGMNIDTHRFELKQEVIADTGIWVAKKRYALHKINDSGYPVDALEIKGLDVVRSNFPKAFQGLMFEILNDILRKEQQQKIDKKILDFREHISDAEVKDIAIPTGVSNLKKFIDFANIKNKKFGNWIKGTPAHVKAALSYNEFLRYLELDGKVQEIREGDKLFWVYLKENPFNIDGLAFRGDEDEDPKEIMEFIETYIDRGKIFDKLFLSKVQDFYNAMKWNVPTYSSAIFDEFFSFE